MCHRDLFDTRDGPRNRRSEREVRVATSNGVGVWIVVGAALLAGAPAAAEPVDGPSAQSGMRAYVDPRTGALQNTPPPGTAMPAPPAFSRSGAGLVESRRPDGSVMIDLQGRFRSPLVATVTPDGTLHIDHGQPPE
jgi:hypothetical protein